MSESPLTRFGLFTFDPHTGSLWRGTELLPLQPKDAAVLHVLLQHAGQVVPREALLEAVWPETYVTETVLKNRITRLRRLLGDDLKSPQYIETRHRRGYRFICHLHPGGPASEEHSLGRTADESGVLPPAVVGPVGRQHELEQLHSWLAQALGGQRRVVFITGEAGIGKTTLVEAFLMQVAARGGVWIAHGQCVEHFGAGEAYRPVLEALDRLCRQPGGTRLVEVLRHEAPTWLAQLPGLLSTAEAEALQRLLQGTTQARMLRELAGALDRLTAETPLVLVVEDLHWSDQATLELLEVVAQRQEPARMLVLGTYRPEDVTVGVHPLPRVVQHLRVHGYGRELPLPVLAEPAVAAYLHGRGLDPEAVRGLAHWLHQRTEGHPLFLVTMVAALVEQGWVGVGAAPLDTARLIRVMAREVPHTLRQGIETRVARLTPAEQQVLETASVEGGEFSAAAVAAGLEQDVVAVARRQHAKMLELRTATSLSRLWQQQGKRNAARRFAGADLRRVHRGL